MDEKKAVIESAIESALNQDGEAVFSVRVKRDGHILRTHVETLEFGSFPPEDYWQVFQLGMQALAAAWEPMQGTSGATEPDLPF